MGHSAASPERAIDVFLADDNLIVREGVRALIERHADLRVVGVAADYDEVVTGAAATEPQVLVTDVRMPPSFQREGIDAAKEVRKRFPGTGVVVLSQYDDPEYAVSLLAEGSAGYGYLLKDRVAEGNQLADAIRSVATGGTALDPAIVESLVRPVIAPGELAPAEIALDTAQALRAGGPWGQAFPEPCFDGLFSIRSARVIAERHVKMWVEVPRSGRAFDAIAFNHLEEGAEFVPPSGLAQLVYRLEVNEYQGERRLQLLVDHVLPAAR